MALAPSKQRERDRAAENRRMRDILRTYTPQATVPEPPEPQPERLKPMRDRPGGPLRQSPAEIADAERHVQVLRMQVRRDLRGLEAIMDRWQALEAPHCNKREAVVVMDAAVLVVGGRQWR